MIEGRIININNVARIAKISRTIALQRHTRGKLLLNGTISQKNTQVKKPQMSEEIRVLKLLCFVAKTAETILLDLQGLRAILRSLGRATQWPQHSCY